MNAVRQRTGNSMDTLARSMVIKSAVLQELGFSAFDITNFLGNDEMSGVDNLHVMKELTKALAIVISYGKSMKEALKDI